MQYAFAWRNRRMLLALVGIWVLFAPIALILRDGPSWFYLGMWTAAIIACGVFYVVVFSGSAYLLTAELAEQWSYSQLDPLRAEGWRVMHRVLFRPPRLTSTTSPRDRRASSSSRRSGRPGTGRAGARSGGCGAPSSRLGPTPETTARYLGSRVGSVPVRPVVTFWPSGDIAEGPRGRRRHRPPWVAAASLDRAAPGGRHGTRRRCNRRGCDRPPHGDA